MADLRSPNHLPNHRRGGVPPDKSLLPRQRRGKTPQMVGRYPDYDVLASSAHWDEATRRVVLARVNPGSGLTFFSVAEEPVVRSFLDLLLDQDAEPRVPVVELVDQRLSAGRLDGYQYDDMPDDRETWHRVLAGLDDAAKGRSGMAFWEAPGTVRETVVADLSRGVVVSQELRHLNPKRAFSVCLRMAVSAFYSHPWAWNEIGFGGPAYPRGFMRTGLISVREPRETAGVAHADDPALVPGAHS